MTPPYWKASDGGSWHAPNGYGGGFPTYRSSIQPTTAPSVWPPRHGVSAEHVSTPPITTIATTMVSPTTRGCSRRGHQ